MSSKFTPSLLALLLTACPSKTEGEKVEPEKTADEKAEKADGPESEAPGVEGGDANESPTTAAHMKDHFAKAEEIKLALIAGDLEKAREPAKWMAEHQAEVEHPEAWKPHVAKMREAAQALGSAEDVAKAAGSFVVMAQSCAACHTAIGGPEIDVGEPPAGDASGDVKAHMATHQWAVDALWQGLMGPSKEAWVAGAEALAQEPLGPKNLAPGQSVPKEIEALATRVHALGSDARDVPDASAIPGEVYGELLTTCATCHEALKKTP
ncbi:hypothetical protein G6O69_07740 [Pseudenhygromyxa sp. WMMC2535]|uniref:hypothetical protein n=1 Tax=Pseudenhygromyxa sp. WMMC2535 TaxID=2712867 RepID=UPI0015582F91|nr:hypothetical protein [Pseudenhygromyxa sp. WMMC2535]NVB37721.1 hypothetical protein [Pseudenhygromyxa sp. WMMC2535]